MKTYAPMKYLLILTLSLGYAFADAPEYPEDMEVGSPKDCVVVGKSNDSTIEEELNQVQHRVMDCLSPDEKDAEAKSETKNPEVVSQ